MSLFFVLHFLYTFIQTTFIEYNHLSLFVEVLGSSQEAAPTDTELRRTLESYAAPY